MKFRPMRFDLYLGRSVFGTVLLTWAVLLGLDVVMAFSGEFKDVGKGGCDCRAGTDLLRPQDQRRKLPGD